MEAVEEVFPKFPIFHIGFEILIGRSNHSDIDLRSLRASYLHDLFLLKNPEKFYLNGGRIVEISSRKSVPPLASSNSPLLA